MEESTIIVDGVKMTMTEFNATYRKEKKAKKKKKATKVSDTNTKEISAVAEQIEKLLKPMTTLKSIQVYKSHAYRSWGKIANEILAHKGISKPMATYSVKYGELNALLAEIQKMAKRNERAAYQYVEKMAWKLDDMKEDIKSLMKGVEESGVCERFKDHEAIYGAGRQLGLATVVIKCLKTIGEMEDVIGTLQKIADEGVDVMNEGAHMSPRARARCWA